MLFIKPIKDITYQDVVDFCNEQIPEGFILDYKREFPSPNDKLAKLIAAFANTYGGVLVIGVNAPKGKPELPVVGIDYNEHAKYEERIQSIIISNIKEPIFPEIHVCHPENNKTFIIVRVAESNLTPHRVGNDRKVYIRTGELNQSTDELERSIDEAPWGKIEWLLSRREQSIQLRQHMISEGDTFYRESFHRFSIEHEKYFGIVTFRILPLFPQGQLCKHEDLGNLERVIRVGIDNICFPPERITLESVQNGLQRLYFTFTEDHKNPKQYEPFFFIHLTNLGMYLYKWDAGVAETISEPDGNKTLKNKSLISIFFITREVYLYLSSALNFFNHIGYWGTLLFEIEFDNVLGIKSEDIFEHLRIPRSHMKWSSSFSVSELQTTKQEIVIEIMSDICWSIGIRKDFKEHIKKYLDQKDFGC